MHQVVGLDIHSKKVKNPLSNQRSILRTLCMTFSKVVGFLLNVKMLFRYDFTATEVMTCGVTWQAQYQGTTYASSTSSLKFTSRSGGGGHQQ